MSQTFENYLPAEVSRIGQREKLSDDKAFLFWFAVNVLGGSHRGQVSRFQKSSSPFISAMPFFLYLSSLASPHFFIKKS
jgi:hypothetical protein